MAEINLVTEKRQGNGKADARRLRRTGKVPGVFYGEIKEPVSIAVDAHELDLLLKKSHSIINVKVDGKAHQAIFREIQYHPVKGNVTHIDLLVIKKGQKVTLEIPLHFEGRAKGIDDGGVFDQVKNEITITVLPKDIPDYISINVEDMEMNDSLRIKDIPKGPFEIEDHPDDVVCRVGIPRPEEEEEEEEIGEDEDMEPEVITARDKDEDSEEDEEDKE